MLIGQVEKAKKYTIIYNFCLVNNKIAPILYQFCTNKYIVFLTLGLYPKNKKKGEKL